MGRCGHALGSPPYISYSSLLVGSGSSDGSAHRCRGGPLGGGNSTSFFGGSRAYEVVETFNPKFLSDPILF